MKMKVRKFLAVSVAVVIILTAAPMSGFTGLKLPNLFEILASAEESTSVLDSLTYEVQGEEVTITGCDKSFTGELVIPETIEMPLADHTITTIRKEPTCTSIGNEQYLCEVCGNMIGDMVILPKLPHAYGEWTIVSAPTATENGSKSHSCTSCGKAETISIIATGFETAEGVAIDFATNTISGFNAGESSLDGYTTVVGEGYTWKYETSNGNLGTGSRAILKDGDTVVGEYIILVYGDVNGDGWYDGMDKSYYSLKVMRDASSACAMSVSQIRKYNNLIVEWYITDDKELYKMFFSHKDEIENEVGFTLDWCELPDKKASRIIAYLHDTDFEDKNAWSKQFDWVMDTAIKMKKAFKKYI